MRLELTYEHQDRFHLLFRWADGNLRDYWERHPQPSDIPRTHAFSIWLSRQFLGLADGLMTIHECPPDSSITADDDTDEVELQRTNGRHGDIKPENILWFQPHEANGDQSAYESTLVISDFGLTEFHRDETGLVNPMNVAMSPTYSAPEYDVSEAISQSYDIWTMGCVYCKYIWWCMLNLVSRLEFSHSSSTHLDWDTSATRQAESVQFVTNQYFIRTVEFIVWYLNGYQAFDQFSKERALEDNSVIRKDNYFKVVGNVQETDGRILKMAVFKKAVASVSKMNSDYLPRALF